jgi:hypothetical protein
VHLASDYIYPCKRAGLSPAGGAPWGQPGCSRGPRVALVFLEGSFVFVDDVLRVADVSLYHPADEARLRPETVVDGLYVRMVTLVPLLQPTLLSACTGDLNTSVPA